MHTLQFTLWMASKICWKCSESVQNQNQIRYTATGCWPHFIFSVSTSKLIRFKTFSNRKLQVDWTFYVWICTDLGIFQNLIHRGRHRRTNMMNLLWTGSECVKEYYAHSLLTRSAIWQTRGWHMAWRNMDDNRCHPSHTVPPPWARLSWRLQNKSCQNEQTRLWFQLDSGGWLYLDTRYKEVGLSSILVAVVTSALVSSRTCPSTCPQGEKQVSESIIRGTTLEGNFKAAFQHSLGGGDGVN